MGIGERIADFVIANSIHGALIQSMFFVPGTAAYDTHKERLIHQNWEKYNGSVVHYPKNMRPYELQQEIINASGKIYSGKQLFSALVTRPFVYKVLFLGEFFWHRSVRQELRKDLPYLAQLENVSH